MRPTPACLSSRPLEATVLSDPAAAKTIWRALIKIAPVSIYQSPAFLVPWLDICEPSMRTKPVFVLISEAGRPLLLQPLGIHRIGPWMLAASLAGKHANVTLPIFDPDILAFGLPAIENAFDEALRAYGVDVITLVNQPREWRGVVNPLLGRAAQPGASRAYALTLDTNADALFARLFSKDRRKKLRQKRKWLGQMGVVRIGEASTAETQTEALAAYFALKARWFDEQGISDPFQDPAIRNWLRTMATQPREKDTAALRLFTLTLDETIVAVWGVGRHDGDVSGMITAFETSPALARCSPGDLLLEDIIRRLVVEGTQNFDFGVGDALYKRTWSDRTIDIFDTFRALGIKGRPLANALSLQTRLKGRIKRSPMLIKLARRWRLA